MRPRGENPSVTQSATRTLAILGMFTQATPRRRVTDIARELDLSPSTVSRLLYSLETAGFVERDPQTGHYGLGLELVALGSRALNGSELYRVAIGDLAAAATELGMSVNLAILRNDALFYLAVVEPTAIMTPISLVGASNHLHSTAMGAVLLAGLSDSSLEATLARLSYPRLTPNTVANAADLRAKVETVRARGWALDREEGALGRGCIAVGIRDGSGAVIAACSVDGPMTVMDLDRRSSQLSARMIEFAEQISRKLGYRLTSTSRSLAAV